MVSLRTELGVADPDEFYARLIALHEGLSADESHKLNAKVILLLANHIGAADVLNQVFEYVENDLKSG